MAQIVGDYLKKIADPTIIDTTASQTFGMQGTDESGYRYIYLKGITSTAAGSWVTYVASTGVTALLAADAVGPVAIAMAATNANTKFGWYMIAGSYASSASDTVAGANGLFIDGTAGRVDDASVAGDMVYGAVATAADAANVLPVTIMYPYVTNTVPA